ncbi:type II secretion system protein GspM [Kozakia baliensis]|uniref:Uncharacterized protein n=1 Tax=Kozakia baliensis TaxID=153496 RepID=A0A1D8UZ39_9PROT|nr:type II secretion system protein GspM [Kozakia baliensis]AOX18842.1 hypothetical protein A0U89_16280 [Kozakia baliensis]GEL65535.1 hypothetical protein KBA01_28210 [Kozakia baliensis]
MQIFEQGRSTLENAIRALPNGRAGQAWALGFAAAIVVLIWLIVIAPIWSLYARRAEALEMQRRMTVQMSALSDALPGLRRASASSPVKTDFLVKGASAAIASANLEDDVQRASSNANVAMASIENAPAMTVGAHQRIGLRLVFDAPFANAVRFMTELEKSSPAVAIDEVHIEASDDDDVATKAMHIEMTVYAFRHGGADKPKDAAP